MVQEILNHGSGGGTHDDLAATAERGGSNLKGCEDLCLENVSSQGQHLALTGLRVPSSLDSGTLASPEAP